MNNNEAITLLQDAADRADAFLELAQLAQTDARAIARLLKEQETVVRCMYCKFRGNTNLCPLAYIEKVEQFTALCTDEWFCGNGKRKEGDEVNGYFQNGNNHYDR